MSTTQNSQAHVRSGDFPKLVKVLLTWPVCSSIFRSYFVVVISVVIFAIKHIRGNYRELDSDFVRDG